jgi:hypothetical protein
VVAELALDQEHDARGGDRAAVVAELAALDGRDRRRRD